MNVIDLFAGPGGWDLAAHALGLDPLGIEWDDAACATRRAAGLRTLQGDVGELDPRQTMVREFGDVGTAPLWGLIASPPCQAFSMAGKGEGRKAIDALHRLVLDMAHGRPVNAAAELADACDDDRAGLVLEPLRWTLALRPRWVACEQVEPVLPLWEQMAAALRLHGYHTWTGVLSAEQYGVPQTRRRAILLASLDGPVTGPPATHQRYLPPRRRDEQTLGLFDAPDPERIVAPEDRQLLPWVSMAEALGWGMTARPYPVIASSRSTGGPDKEKVGGSTARAAIYDEQAAGRWLLRASVSDEGTAKAHPRALDEPAQTVTGKHRSAEWVVRTGTNSMSTSRDLDAMVPYERPVDAPAPTVDGKTGTAWKVGPQQERIAWADRRPATTVNGDPRISEPGWRGAPRDYDADGNYIGKRSMDNAVRVTEAEALVLQSFPPDYPVQGTKTKRFEQIGNAVPPLLALAVLAVVVPAEAAGELAA